jgi:hypothetical protein
VARKVVLFIIGYFLYVPLVFGGIAVGVYVADKYVDVSENPVPGWLMLVLLIVIIGAPAVIFSITWNRPPRWAQKVQKGGQPGTATIVNVADTGVSSGGGLTICVRLTLRVQPAGGGTPFDATIETPNSRVGFMRPGDVLAVKYDPLNLKHVVLDASEESVSGVASARSALDLLSNSRPDLASQLERALQGASPGMPGAVYVLGRDGHVLNGEPGHPQDLAGQLAKLDQLHREGSLTDAEYKAAKAKLLS